MREFAPFVFKSYNVSWFIGARGKSGEQFAGLVAIFVKLNVKIGLFDLLLLFSPMVETAFGLMACFLVL